MLQSSDPERNSATTRLSVARWWLALALALALVLRLLLPGLAPLDEEGAGALLRAERIRDGGVVFTGAPTGGDLMQPPTGAWLDALALRLWADPRTLVVLHGLVGAAATALVWDSAWRAWGPKAGLMAALTYALHPMAVHSARNLSPGAWIAPVAALALHGLALVFSQGDRRGWIEAGIAAGLALALHLAAWPIAAVVILAAACSPHRSHTAEAAMGLGGGLLMALPQLAYQARYGGYDLLGAWGAGSGAPTAGLGAAWRALLASVSTWHAASGLVRPLPTVLAWLTVLLGGAAVLLTLRQGLRRWARALVLEDVPPELLTIGWMLLTALGSALTSADLGDAGLTMLIPAASLCVGAAATTLVPAGWRRAWGVLVTTWLVALSVTTVSAYDAALPTLRDAMALRTALAQRVPDSMPLYVAGLNRSATPYGPQGWRWLLSARASSMPETGDDAEALPVPLGRDAYYLLGAPGLPLEGLEALGAEPLALPSDQWAYRPLLYRLPAVDPALLLGMAPQRTNVAFGEALHLLGYAWKEPVVAGAPRTLRTVWLIDRAVSGHPRLLVQLVGEDGVWAEAAGLGYPASDWQADTAVIAWHRLAPREPTPDDCMLVIGWYDAQTLAPWRPAPSHGDAYLALDVVGSGVP